MHLKKSYILFIVIVALLTVTLLSVNEEKSYSATIGEKSITYEDINSNNKIDTGDIVSIYDEKFYVVDSDDKETSLLAFYNIDLKEIKQSKEALGDKMVIYNNDTVSFDDVDRYLKDYENILKEYLDNKVTLVSKEDMKNLNISENDSISNKLDFIYSTSYWVNEKKNPYYVSSASYYGKYDGDVSYDEEYGVRPLVTIEISDQDKLEFVKDNNKNKKIDKLDIVKINNEEFYCIEVTDKEIKLLARYNLNLKTNLQDEKSLGFIIKNESKETVAFSSKDKKGEYYSSYQGSIVEEYVNKYGEYLENTYDVGLLKVSLIDEDILEKLGCSFDNNTCIEAFDWLYKTSYWIDYRMYEDEEFYIHSNGELNMDVYSNDKSFGVRPLIKIETSKIK